MQITIPGGVGLIDISMAKAVAKSRLATKQIDGYLIRELVGFEDSVSIADQLSLRLIECL
jgi:hypothetical protein